MAEDNVAPEAKPSWHEREIASALARLANARAQLALLEEQAEDAAAAPEPDPADVALVEQLQRQIIKLTSKAAGRFGASSARTKLADVTRQRRLVLDRLGYVSYEAFQAGEASSAPGVDPEVLDFARRECDDAQRAFLEITALEIPEAEPDPDADAPDAEVLASPATFAGASDDIDLRISPSAAS